MENGQSAGKEFAYLLGVYLGDGCILQDKRWVNIGYKFQLVCIDYDFIEKVQQSINILLEKLPNIKTVNMTTKGKENRKQQYKMVISNIFWKTFVDDTCNKKIIPEYVWNWDKELIKQFIIGIMDSEGYCAKCKKYTGTIYSYQLGIGMAESYTWDIWRLFQKIGTETTQPQLMLQKVKMRKDGTPHKDCFRWQIKIPSFDSSGLYFNIKRKQERVEEYLHKKRIQPQRLYDIT